MIPESCTNWYRTRRHLSINLEPTGTGGREGKSLCRVGGFHVDVEDQDRVNRNDGMYRPGATPVNIDFLPACKLCQRAATKLAEEA